MMRAGHTLYEGELAGELGVVWAAVVPECPARWALVEPEHFLDAAVAIRRDDQKGTRRITGRWQRDYHIVMELTLLPVVDDLEVTKTLTNGVQQGAKRQGLG